MQAVSFGWEQAANLVMVTSLLRRFFSSLTISAFGLQKRALCGLDKVALQAEGLREAASL